jgi:hypothetical protein
MLIYKRGQVAVFRNGETFDCSPHLPLPAALPDEVQEIRVRADGTIERYSEVDWAWKAAPELQPFVDGLNTACDSVQAETIAALQQQLEAKQVEANAAPVTMKVQAG